MVQDTHSASRRSSRRNKKKRERRKKQPKEIASTAQIQKDLRVEHPDDRLLPGFVHV